MVGYCQQSKAYRMFNPINKKVLISRDVVFSEDQFLAKEVTDLKDKSINHFHFIIEDNLKPVVNDNEVEDIANLNEVVQSTEEKSFVQLQTRKFLPRAVKATKQVANVNFSDQYSRGCVIWEKCFVLEAIHARRISIS